MNAYGRGMLTTMTSPEAQHARQRLRKLARDRQRIANAETTAITEALRLGVRQVDVASDASRTREHIRRIAKTHGIPSRYTQRGTTDPAEPETPTQPPDPHNGPHKPRGGPDSHGPVSG